VSGFDPTASSDTLRAVHRYEYASRSHALLQFMWHTGCRISGAIAVDLDDYRPAESHIKFRDRENRATALKKGHKSERNVTLDESTIQVVSDYVKARRESIIDEDEREPLFTTPQQRLTRQRAYRDFTALSRPCKIGNNCPHDRRISNCEAAQRKKSASKCPSSQSLHPIRRGSITYHLNSGWNVEDVSARCDVSVPILEKHYDVRTHENKREDRAEKISNL
jgi:integrase